MRRLIPLMLLLSIFLSAETIKIATSSLADTPLLKLWKDKNSTLKVEKNVQLDSLAYFKEHNLSFAIVNSHCAYYAYKGESPFDHNTTPKLRSIVSLYPKILTLIVPKESNITSFLDLQKRSNKIITTFQTCENLLKILDVNISQQSLSFEDAKQALKKGKIDGFFTLVAHPDPQITQLNQEQNITFVPLFGKRFDQLNNDYPYILKSGIPKGLYKGQDHDIKSIGIKALLLTSEDTNETTVYNLTKMILENIPTLKTANPIYRGISKKSLLEQLSIPQHKGATKAFNEF